MVREIELNHICKIEGHASLALQIEKGKVKGCELEAEEGARFFEGLVVGKYVIDIQEIVSRICGICSSAHGVVAITALEKAMGITPTEREKIIRDILIIGERIRSHATHLYFLALPDYLGYSAITMARQYKQEVDDALKIVRAGNKIVARIGGRELHPFVKFHTGTVDFSDLKKELTEIKPLAEKTLKLFLSLEYPDFEKETRYLCLREEDKYAFSSGKIISDCGTINTEDYKQHLTENIKEYATSKFVMHEGKSYLTGSLVRINNNADVLDDETKKLIAKFKIKLPLKNPFMNNVAQAIETYSSINIAINLLEELEKNKDEPRAFDYSNKSGRGVAAVEAPRGTLFHEYEVKDGKVVYCNIITPTAQNLNQIEIDIKDYVDLLLEKKAGKQKIISEVEKLIRAYDPCFSCSTHFLNVDWKETD